MIIYFVVSLSVMSFHALCVASVCGVEGIVVCGRGRGDSGLWGGGVEGYWFV